MRLFFLDTFLLFNFALFATTSVNATGEMEVIVANIQATVDGIQAIATTVNETVGHIEQKVDAMAEPSSDVWMRFGHLVFRGQGCDGIDNNGIDGIDDCREDRTPPVISTTGEVPELFASTIEAENWFRENVFATDDCVANVEMEYGDILKVPDEKATFNITTRAIDRRCEGESSDAYESERTFRFRIDGDAPNVIIGQFTTEQDPLYRKDLCHSDDHHSSKSKSKSHRMLTEGDSHRSSDHNTSEEHRSSAEHSESPDDDSCPSKYANGTYEDPLFISSESAKGRDFVNVGLNYTIVDESDIESVEIEVYSSEYEYDDPDSMSAIFLTGQFDDEVSDDSEYPLFEVLLAPFTCDQKGIDRECRRNAETEATTRMYQIVVTATDSAGNVGSNSAYVVAWWPGPEYSYSKSRKTKGGKTPKADAHDTIIFSGRKHNNKHKGGRNAKKNKIKGKK